MPNTSCNFDGKGHIVLCLAMLGKQIAPPAHRQSSQMRQHWPPKRQKARPVQPRAGTATACHFCAAIETCQGLPVRWPVAPVPRNVAPTRLHLRRLVIRPPAWGPRSQPAGWTPRMHPKAGARGCKPAPCLAPPGLTPCGSTLASTLYPYAEPDPGACCRRLLLRTMARARSVTAPTKARDTSAIRTTSWSVDTAGPLIHRKNGARTTMVQQNNSASHQVSAGTSAGGEVWTLSGRVEASGSITTAFLPTKGERHATNLVRHAADGAPPLEWTFWPGR